MDNEELKWIAEAAEKLQTPQTWNERQRLLKIVATAIPYVVNALDETAHMSYGQVKTCTDLTEQFVKTGETCNGCGQDSDTDGAKPKHRDTGVNRDGAEGKMCAIEHLYQFLEELEKESDK